MAREWVDFQRVQQDFDDFLEEFGTPIYRRGFTSASTHRYYGTVTYGGSATESFVGTWRFVTAEDYRLIESGRVEVGDVISLVPSGTTVNKTDEWWLKGHSATDDYYNVTWTRPQLIGSQVAFREVQLQRARGKR